MKYLESLILEKIYTADKYPWFPGLSKTLVTQEQYKLKQKCGIKAVSYSSPSMLNGSDKQVEQLTHVYGNRIPIIPLSDECVDKGYHHDGYVHSEVLPGSVRDCIEESFTILEIEKTIAETVLSLVKNLHILKPRDDEYDTSYSMPNIPFSIFVSVPSRRIKHDSLRVAEAILHESMHLQLSLIEKHICLVADENLMFYSPWKLANRSVRGILHALYVFQTIRNFISLLLNNKQYGSIYSYLNRRIINIDGEISSIIGFEKSNALTDAGKLLAQQLIKSY